MTDLDSSRPAVGPARAAAPSPAPEPTAWTGWVMFASVMVFLLGSTQAIKGLVAAFDDGFYALIVHGREVRSSRM